MCSAKKLFVSMENDIPSRTILCDHEEPKSTHSVHFSGKFEWVDEGTN